MSTRSNLRPQQVIPSPLANPANTGSMAANITSQPTILQSLSLISYGVSWTGTSPVGSLSVEASNDYALNPDGTVHNAGTWNTMTLQLNGASVTSIPVSGNSGSGLIDIDGTAAYALRLVYSAASGVGQLVAIVNGKVS